MSVVISLRSIYICQTGAFLLQMWIIPFYSASVCKSLYTCQSGKINRILESILPITTTLVTIIWTWMELCSNIKETKFVKTMLQYSLPNTPQQMLSSICLHWWLCKSFTLFNKVIYSCDGGVFSSHYFYYYQCRKQLIWWIEIKKTKKQHVFDIFFFSFMSVLVCV